MISSLSVPLWVHVLRVLNIHGSNDITFIFRTIFKEYGISDYLSISNNIVILEKQGYVSINIQGRCKIISLTKKGKQLSEGCLIVCNIQKQKEVKRK